MNLIKDQRPDIDKIYLHTKDLFKSNYQLPINGREKVEIKKLKYLKAFIDYSPPIDDVYEKLEGYYSTNKRRVLTAFDDMIGDIESNKRLRSILNSIKVLVFFEKKTSKKKHLCRHDKNYCYFCKLNIPVINLIVGSRI